VRTRTRKCRQRAISRSTKAKSSMRSPRGSLVAIRSPLDAEIQDLIAQYGGRSQQGPDGQRYLVLERFPLGSAWSPPACPLAIRLTGYPEAALDGFYIPGTVRLASGSQPASASLTAVLGPELWWAFSYHPQGWRSGRHSLRSFVGFVRQRFLEAR
jgi:hypothetical protein